MKHSLFICTSCFLPHLFHPIHWDQAKELVCRSLGSRPTQAQELFTPVSRLFGTTSRCLSAQTFQLLPSRNIWRRVSLTRPLPHRHQHMRLPVDATELFHRCCCWTLIQLLWAIEPGFARDIEIRNLIDWLVDNYLVVFTCSCTTQLGFL